MSEETELIELPDNVIEDLQERREKQQRLYQELREKQEEFEEVAASNQEYMKAIGDLKGIENIERYQVVEDGLKRLSDEEIQQAPQPDVETKESFEQISTNYDEEEAVEKVKALGETAAKQFVDEEETRPEVLRALANK